MNNNSASEIAANGWQAEESKGVSHFNTN